MKDCLGAVCGAGTGVRILYIEELVGAAEGELRPVTTRCKENRSLTSTGEACNGPYYPIVDETEFPSRRIPYQLGRW